MEIKNLLESANPWQSQQTEVQKFVKKWTKTGLLEGLDYHGGNTMAMLLENQAKQLVVESSTTGTGASFNTGQGEQWAGVALPMVRKVFGSIASKDFVSVQPMNLPSGLVFFLDFQYGTGGGKFAAGSSLYGITSSSADPNGGLYGAGRWGYSINQFSASVSSSAANYTSASATWSEVGYDSTFSASAAAGQIVKVTIPTASVSSAVDLNGVRAFLLVSGSLIGAAQNLSQFNSTNASQNAINFFVTASSVSLASTFQVLFSKTTQDNARGDYEDTSATSLSVPNSGSASSIVIPELNVSLRSESITAKTRRLKAQWTPEFSQDLNAYQSLDAEAEVTSMMSEYISLEIDLEILDMLIQNAPIVDYWSAVNNTTVSAGSNPAATLGYYNSQGGWFQTLGTKIQKVSNQIHQRTMRGGANFMVLSPTVSTVIESIPGFSSDASGDVADMKYAFGVQKVGTFNSRYKVYKNPYMTENVILLGLRGSQFLETGAVFAPYIPLIMTPLVYDPNTFTPRKGLLTRYAKKMVRPEFFGKIYVSGLNTV